MNGLEANTYINAASEALQNDPEYNRWFDALVKEREAMQECGVNTGKIEGILFEIWNQRICYILDNLETIKKMEET